MLIYIYFSLSYWLDFCFCFLNSSTLQTYICFFNSSNLQTFFPIAIVFSALQISKLLSYSDVKTRQQWPTTSMIHNFFLLFSFFLFSSNPLICGLDLLVYLYDCESIEMKNPNLLKWSGGVFWLMVVIEIWKENYWFFLLPNELILSFNYITYELFLFLHIKF